MSEVSADAISAWALRLARRDSVFRARRGLPGIGWPEPGTSIKSRNTSRAWEQVRALSPDDLIADAPGSFPRLTPELMAAVQEVATAATRAALGTPNGSTAHDPVWLPNLAKAMHILSDPVSQLVASVVLGDHVDADGAPTGWTPGEIEKACERRSTGTDRAHARPAHDIGVRLVNLAALGWTLHDRDAGRHRPTYGLRQLLGCLGSLARGPVTPVVGRAAVADVLSRPDHLRLLAHLCSDSAQDVDIREVAGRMGLRLDATHVDLAALVHADLLQPLPGGRSRVTEGARRLLRTIEAEWPSLVHHVTTGRTDADIVGVFSTPARVDIARAVLMSKPPGLSPDELVKVSGLSEGKVDSGVRAMSRCGLLARTEYSRTGGGMTDVRYAPGPHLDRVLQSLTHLAEAFPPPGVHRDGRRPIGSPGSEPIL